MGLVALRGGHSSGNLHQKRQLKPHVVPIISQAHPCRTQVLIRRHRGSPCAFGSCKRFWPSGSSIPLCRPFGTGGPPICPRCISPPNPWPSHPRDHLCRPARFFLPRDAARVARFGGAAWGARPRDPALSISADLGLCAGPGCGPCRAGTLFQRGSDRADGHARSPARNRLRNRPPARGVGAGLAFGRLWLARTLGPVARRDHPEPATNRRDLYRYAVHPVRDPRPPRGGGAF